MISVQTTLPTDDWVPATWEEYEQAIATPAYSKAKGYYHNGKMRIETVPVGPNHASSNSIVGISVSLFGIAKGLPMDAIAL